MFSAWTNKGIALINLDRNDEAIKAFDEVIRLDPNNVLAWTKKGYALVSESFTEGMKIGSTDSKYTALAGEAINAFDEAIRLDPNNALAWSGKGMALNILNRKMDADAAFAKAKELGHTG